MKAYEERHDGKSHESGKQCFDGIDNDGDGEKDCEDPDCQIMREGHLCREIESLGNQIEHGRTDIKVPKGCINWFDGCNACKRQNMNSPMKCGEKKCFRQGKSECRAYDRSYDGPKDSGKKDIRDKWQQGGRNSNGDRKGGNWNGGGKTGWKGRDVNDGGN